MRSAKTGSQLPRRLEYIRLDEVKYAPRNPKAHDHAGIGRSIDHHGFVEVPTIDERTGLLIAGHGRHIDLTEKREAGKTPPDGVLVADDGMWLMPALRGWASRSDADAEAYLIASNQLTTAGGWETGLSDVLVDLQKSGLLDLTGFTDDDLTDLLAEQGNPFDYREAGDGADESDAAPPLEPVTMLGDVWTIGRHRVLCGSATSRADIARVLDGREPEIVYTDPPYGISIVRGGAVGGGGPVGGKGRIGSGAVVKTTEYKPVIGDDSTTTARDSFAILHSDYPSAMHIWWGANHYAGDAGLPNASCWLVWDKQNGENDFADAELAWTNHHGAVRVFQHMWNGMIRASERAPRVHPNQKPAALAAWALDLVDPDHQRSTVLDVFGGSGSTALGAHLTNRAARIIELDPEYVDVICRRLQELTGELPYSERLAEPVDLIGRDTAVPDTQTADT